MALSSHARSDEVQTLRPQVSISPKHLPVFVARHERNLRDLKACLEKPAGPFVAQVVEVKIDYAEISASAAECRPS